MRKHIFIVVATGILAAVVFFLKNQVGMSQADALAFVALIGVAAALAVLLPMDNLSKGRIYVSDSCLYLLGEEVWEFKFRATLMNVGDADDSLLNIEHRLYKRHFGFLSSYLTSGARKLMEERGHVLPYPLPTRIACVVEGVGGVSGTPRKMAAMVSQGGNLDDYILLCKFCFSKVKPITVRMTVSGVIQRSRPAAWCEEAFLWIRTLGRNPLDPNTK